MACPLAAPHEVVRTVEQRGLACSVILGGRRPLRCWLSRVLLKRRFLLSFAIPRQQLAGATSLLTVFAGNSCGGFFAGFSAGAWAMSGA